MGHDARLQVGRGGGLVLRPLGVFKVQQCRGVTQGQESGVGPGVGDGMPGWPGEEVQRVVHELQVRGHPGGGHFAKDRCHCSDRDVTLRSFVRRRRDLEPPDRQDTGLPQRRQHARGALRQRWAVRSAWPSTLKVCACRRCCRCRWRSWRYRCQRCAAPDWRRSPTWPRRRLSCQWPRPRHLGSTWRPRSRSPIRNGVWPETWEGLAIGPRLNDGSCLQFLNLDLASR